MEKPFSQTRLTHMLVSPNQNPLTEIFDDSVLLCQLFEKKSLLTFNSENLVTLLPPKAVILVKIVNSEAVCKEKSTFHRKKQKNCLFLRELRLCSY